MGAIDDLRARLAIEENRLAVMVGDVERARYGSEDIAAQNRAIQLLRRRIDDERHSLLIGIGSAALKGEEAGDDQDAPTTCPCCNGINSDRCLMCCGYGTVARSLAEKLDRLWGGHVGRCDDPGSVPPPAAAPPSDADAFRGMLERIAAVEAERDEAKGRAAILEADLDDIVGRCARFLSPGQWWQLTGIGHVPSIVIERDEAKAEVERLREMKAERDALRSALEDLMAVQNGPPLYTCAKAWEKAMAAADAALGATATDKDTNLCP